MTASVERDDRTEAANWAVVAAVAGLVQGPPGRGTGVVFAQQRGHDGRGVAGELVTCVRIASTWPAKLGATVGATALHHRIGP
jgi:hypothetical protein